MRELIKSMREATMKSGMLESSGGELGQDLLDQQLAVQMSGRPGGLSDIITRQLMLQTAPATELPVPQAQVTPTSVTPARVANPAPAGPAQAGFVTRHTATAARVAQDSGIPSGFMLGQAGHETGWGKHEIKLPDGATSFNLFGIKAAGALNAELEVI